MFQTISIIIIGGFHTLFSWNIIPANGHSESVIRGSIVTENAASDGNNFDEDLCTNDIGQVITMLQHQIIDNDRLAKELEVYLCKVCRVNYVNIIITPCHHVFF